ncbi:MAG: arsenate reductase family protein [Deltaproteobacteria bacterium]|nr:arsenate reductase family protein [Deltaproteobacteria bacterium]
MSLKLYGITTCGTVKKARAWLDSRGAAYQWSDLREEPPTRAQIDGWMAIFGAKAMRNTSGGAYRALGPEKAEWSDAQWAEAFAADPMLLKRPILERDGAPVQVGFRGTDAEFEARLLG